MFKLANRVKPCDVCYYLLNWRERTEGSVFVITGGGSGVGQALAQELAVRKKTVFIIGRRESKLQETASFSPFIEYLCADISTPEGRETVVHKLSSLGAITGLIHNAGIIEPIVPILEIKETAWQKIMATNVEAPLFLTQHLVSQLQEGRVLNIGSGAAYFPIKGWAAYCTAKAALSMLTRCFALECQKPAITSVMPGIINTDMQALARHSLHMDPAKLDFFKRLKQENKLLSPQVVAHFLCWLLLSVDETTYVAQEWDIYDASHHEAWLTLSLQVPPLEE